MRKGVLIFCLLSVTLLYANDKNKINEKLESNSAKSGLRESNFQLKLDLQTKYVWRGMEMIDSESAPVLFPGIGYSYKGLYAYVMGGYALNGKYAEVDLGLSYTLNWITLGLNNYYYPSIDSKSDDYFTFNNSRTKHWWEVCVTLAPEKIPAYLTVSNFFAGNDKRRDGKQAYSTYAELGGYYEFLHDNRFLLVVGATLNESCYNNYKNKIGICNIEAKYTYTIHLKKNIVLPLGVAYIINPIFEKSFVNFTVNICL